jgi:hypothetical protein
MKLIKHQASKIPSNDVKLHRYIETFLVECSENFSVFIYFIAVKDHAFNASFPR